MQKTVAQAKADQTKDVLAVLYERRFALEDARNKLVRELEQAESRIKWSVVGIRAEPAKIWRDAKHTPTFTPDVTNLTDQQVVDAIMSSHNVFPGENPTSAFKFFYTNDPGIIASLMPAAEDAIFSAMNTIVAKNREENDIDQSLKEVNAEIARLSK